jgi:hypothetical protein
MTTLTQLVDRVQLLLNDTAATIWAQTDLEEWVVDGIRAYSIHFPRTAITTWVCTANDHTYNLPADFLAVLNIEHPTSEDPPQYLTRLARTHPSFWLYDTYYDVETLQSDPTRVATLYISDTPAGTETTTLTYAAYHSPAVNTVPPPTAAITVPAYHEHIIEQYAIWQANLERLNTEIQAPDTTIRLIQQYKLAVQATESSYRASLRAALSAMTGGGWTGPWQVDGHDRIY